MATIRLVPSTYAVSNSSYVSVSSASNMYTNTDSTSYGTITHNRASTSNTYYAYIRGFNFGDVPSNATINSFTVKIKAKATGHTTSTSSSYYMSLINGTTQIGSTSASGRLTTTTTTFTFANGSLTWSQIVGYGSNFGIRIPLRRQSTNTADVVSVYGAEIEVNYTLPVSSTHTITMSTNETDIRVTGFKDFSSSGKWQNSTIIDDNKWFLITIQGNLNNIVVTDNNIDVTSSLSYSDDDGQKLYDQYSYSKYNVHEDHDIVISHSLPNITYTVTASTTESNWTVVTSADEYNGIVGAGRGCMVYIDSVDTLNVQCIDNNVDVTSSLIYVPESTYSGYTDPAYFYFPIDNISENHTVVISRSNTPSVRTISATSTCDAIYNVYAGSSSSGTTYIGVGGSCEIMFSGYKNTPSTGFVITDNNVDVSNSLVYNNDDTGYYTYTITNIQSDHNVVISYTGETYKITTRSSDTSQFRTGVNYYTGSHNPNNSTEEITVFAGDNLICYVYWGTSSSWSGYPSNMHILDNDVDVTNLFSSATVSDGNMLYYYEYLSNISSDHTILVYAGDVYIRVISTDPTLYLDIYQGTSHNMTDFRGVTIGSNCGIDIYNTDAQSTDFLQDVIATDNGVNINNLLVYYTATGEEGASAYYEYTLNNVQTSHTIVLSSSKDIIYFKSNGSWLQTTKVYKKSNNTWVEQSDYSSLFSNNDIWIKV